jgi:hypothetical protein
VWVAAFHVMLSIRVRFTVLFIGRLLTLFYG